jgi:hypothetical protein
MTKQDIEISVPAPKSESDWGYTSGRGRRRYFRNVLVEPSGDVLAWNDLEGCYTRVHNLSDELISEAQRLAGLVHAGTH